jgi:hypothetical protein
MTTELDLDDALASSVRPVLVVAGIPFEADRVEFDEIGVGGFRRGATSELEPVPRTRIARVEFLRESAFRAGVRERVRETFERGWPCRLGPAAVDDWRVWRLERMTDRLEDRRRSLLVELIEATMPDAAAAADLDRLAELYGVERRWDAPPPARPRLAAALGALSGWNVRPDDREQHRRALRALGWSARTTGMVCDPDEAWELFVSRGLVPPDWLADWDRDAPCGHTWRDEIADRDRADKPCPDCRVARAPRRLFDCGLGCEPGTAPPTVAACVAFASDAANVLAAEAIVREATGAVFVVWRTPAQRGGPGVWTRETADAGIALRALGYRIDHVDEHAAFLLYPPLGDPG